MEARSHPSHTDDHPPRAPLKRAAVAVLLYIAIGAAWIAGSGVLVSASIRDPQWLAHVQAWKDWVFLVATGALLLLVLYRLFRKDSAIVDRYRRRSADLYASNLFHEGMIDNAGVWINVLDSSGRITVWNKVAEQISGYRREEVLGRDDIWKRLYPDRDYRESVATKAIDVLSDGVDVQNLETRIRCRNGQYRFIAWNSRRFVDENGEKGSIVLGRDVTEHRQTQQKLQARDRELALLMANVPGMVYRRRCNEDWTMLFVSSGCLGVTGYTADDMIDNRNVSYASLVYPEDRKRALLRTRKAVLENQPFTLEYRIQHRNGQHRWVWEQGRAIQGEEGPYLEGIIVNITDRKRMERQLEQLAVQDPLTGLHNRRELQIALQEHVRRARTRKLPLSMLWIDVDNFKTINDRHGHLVGDEVLRQVAYVIRDYLRAEDLGARYGGDEFVILLPDIDTSPATRMAEILLQAIRSIHVSLASAEALRITASIGVASMPEHASEAEPLSDAADAAMYRAKRSGRDQVCSAVPYVPGNLQGKVWQSPRRD